jgi:glycine betaine/proline transport system substrate-binding protein
VFSGSEPATVAELDARAAAEEPIIMYWWTPTAAVAKYDLVNVSLPAYNDECGASAAAGDGGVDCDYPEDVLYKAASAKLEEKAPDVFSFLQAFTLTTEDQLSMLPPVEIDGLDPAAVAADWVAANESIWSTWLP